MNYKGSIVNQVFAAIEKKPNLTIGELLYSFLNKKRLGKNFVEATDEEIYTSLENFLYEQEDEDEPYDEVSFEFWVAQKEIVKE